MTTFTDGSLTYTKIRNTSPRIASVTGPGAALGPTVIIPTMAVDDTNFYAIVEIGDNAFSNISTIASVTIPSSITNIGDMAFESCANLASVNFIEPSAVNSISTATFEDCISLNSINIPSSVTTIKSNAFSGCIALKSLTIPSTVTNIEQDAFYGSSNLASVYFDASPDTGTNLPQLNSESFHGGTAYYHPNVLDNNGNPISEYQTYFQGFGFADASNIWPTMPLMAPRSFMFPMSITCFKEDTKILTNKGYIPVQYLRKGDLIKTFQNDYLPIAMIGKKDIYHPASKERIKDQLYRCPKNHFQEIFEDVIITGCHSILVDYFISDEEVEKTIEVNKKIYITDDKYRLPACVDERTVVYEHPGDYTIYHLALENDDYYMNYGIYANGLLVETCSKRYLKEMADMTLID